MKKLLLGTAVAAALAAGAVPFALAQGNAAQSPSNERVQVQDERRAKPFRMPSERADKRLSRLKSELKITAAQEPQWNEYAETVRKHARETDKRIASYRAGRASGAKRPARTVVERMEQRQVRLKTASERLGETIAAVRPLYAALSPEQQKVFDEHRARGRGHHRHGRPQRG